MPRPSDESSPVYRFETVQVDVRKQILSVDGRPVDVEPKPFALLAVLAEANGGLVSKNELLERLWPRQVVSEAVLTQCVLRARQAIGDTAHRIIVTVHRQGYRLGVPLHEQDAAIASQPNEPEQASPLAMIQPKRRWFRVALLALVLLGAVLYTLLRSKSPPATPSVAVMPRSTR